MPAAVAAGVLVDAPPTLIQGPSGEPDDMEGVYDPAGASSAAKLSLSSSDSPADHLSPTRHQRSSTIEE